MLQKPSMQATYKWIIMKVYLHPTLKLKYLPMLVPFTAPTSLISTLIFKLWILHLMKHQCYLELTHFLHGMDILFNNACIMHLEHFWKVMECKCNLHKFIGACPGVALNFFSGRGVQPGFPKCGACELFFVSERGLVNWNFHIWGLRAKIWVKIEAVV